MPVIIIEGPHMTKKQKSQIVESFSHEASKIMNLPVEAMTIIIREVEAENVGVGDRLLCDLH